MNLSQIKEINTNVIDTFVEIDGTKYEFNVYYTIPTDEGEKFVDYVLDAVMGDTYRPDLFLPSIKAASILFFTDINTDDVDSFELLDIAIQTNIANVIEQHVNIEQYSALCVAAKEMISTMMNMSKVELSTFGRLDKLIGKIDAFVDNSFTIFNKLDLNETASAIRRIATLDEQTIVDAVFDKE